MKQLQPDDGEIRRLNLQRLIDEAFGGNQSRFVSTYELNQGEISALLRGVRAFGERKARNLESKIGLAHKALDLPNPREIPVLGPLEIEENNEPKESATEKLGRKLALRQIGVSLARLYDESPETYRAIEMLVRTLQEKSK